MSTIKANYLLDAAGTGAPSFTNGMKSDVFRDLSDIERARFASGYFRLAGGGIQFNGDTAAANALNDYEEGTWTPTLYGETTPGVTTYTTRTGSYLKVGKLVYVACSLVWTAQTGSGRLRVSGLPFPANTHSVSLAWYQNVTMPAGQILGCEASGSELLFMAWQTGSANVAIGPFDSAGSVDLTIVFTVA